MSVTTDQVWQALERGSFGVLAFTNREGHPRSAGVCYVVDHRALFISTNESSWKVRHLSARPQVSMTVALPKRVPFLPFIKVSAATITFQGVARILAVEEVEGSVFERLPLGGEKDPDVLRSAAVIKVTPRGDFVTYGIAMPITRMRKHEEAHGRAPCGTDPAALEAARSPRS